MAQQLQVLYAVAPPQARTLRRYRARRSVVIGPCAIFAICVGLSQVLGADGVFQVVFAVAAVIWDTLAMRVGNRLTPIGTARTFVSMSLFAVVAWLAAWCVVTFPLHAALTGAALLALALAALLVVWMVNPHTRRTLSEVMQVVGGIVALATLALLLARY